MPLPEGRLLEESDGSAVSCGNPQNDMDARVRVARAVRKKLLMLYGEAGTETARTGRG